MILGSTAIPIIAHSGIVIILGIAAGMAAGMTLGIIAGTIPGIMAGVHLGMGAGMAVGTAGMDMDGAIPITVMAGVDGTHHTMVATITATEGLATIMTDMV